MAAARPSAAVARRAAAAEAEVGGAAAAGGMKPAPGQRRWLLEALLLLFVPPPLEGAGVWGGDDVTVGLGAAAGAAGVTCPVAVAAAAGGGPVPGPWGPARGRCRPPVRGSPEQSRSQGPRRRRRPHGCGRSARSETAGWERPPSLRPSGGRAPPAPAAASGQGEPRPCGGERGVASGELPGACRGALCPTQSLLTVEQWGPRRARPPAPPAVLGKPPVPLPQPQQTAQCPPHGLGLRAAPRGPPEHSPPARRAHPRACGLLLQQRVTEGPGFRRLAVQICRSCWALCGVREPPSPRGASFMQGVRSNLVSPEMETALERGVVLERGTGDESVLFLTVPGMGFSQKETRQRALRKTEELLLSLSTQSMLNRGSSRKGKRTHVFWWVKQMGTGPSRLVCIAESLSSALYCTDARESVLPLLEGHPYHLSASHHFCYTNTRVPQWNDIWTRTQVRGEDRSSWVWLG